MESHKLLFALFSFSVVATWVAGFLLVRTPYGSDPSTVLYSLLYFTLLGGLLLFVSTSPVFLWTVMGWNKKENIDGDEEST